MKLEFEQNPNPMFIYDRGTLAFLAVNNAAIRHYGYSRAEFLSMTVRDIHPADLRVNLEKELPRNETSLLTADLNRHMLKNGKEIYVQITGSNINYPGTENARMILVNDVTRLIRLESKLEQTREKMSRNQQYLTRILNHLPGVVFQFTNDKNWSLQFTSTGIKTLTGYPPEYFIGHGYEVYAAMIHAEDRQRVRNEIRNAIKGKKLYRIEYRIQTATGKLKWVSERGLAIEEKGEEIVIDGFLSDITQLKDVETDLIQREQQFRSLFDYNPLATYCLDMEGRIILANKMTEKFSGYDINELIGMNVKSTVPTENRAYLNKMFAKSINGDIHTFEIRVNKKNGKPLILKITNMPMLINGEQAGVIGIAEDVTEKQRAEEARRRSEELFRQLFELTPVGVVFFNKEKRFAMVNNEFKNIFGYSEEDVIGKTVNEVMTPKNHHDEPDRFFERLYNEGELKAETIRLAKDGRVIPVLIYSSVVEVEGQLEGNLVTYVDISEQKKAEQTLQISLKEKEILLAEIHHRVKNNLAIVYGLLQMQLFKNADNRQIGEILLKSQSRIRSIAMIHEKLYKSDNFSEINFAEYIKDLVNQLCATFKNDFKKIKTVTNAAPVSLNITQAVPCALILNELVVNVFKHAFPGKKTGKLQVDLKLGDGGVVTLGVEDNGIGIQEKGKLLEAPTLGMTLIKTLVQQLNADYRVNGSGGTRVEVSFSINK